MVVILIILFSLPVWGHGPELTFAHLEPSHDSFWHNWKSFVGVILALSGVEAVANLTGVMKLDEGSPVETPQIARTARRAIWVVALEVVAGTALLGWAMLSLDKGIAAQMAARWEDMLSLLAEQYGAKVLGTIGGEYFGLVVGIIVTCSSSARSTPPSAR